MIGFDGSRFAELNQATADLRPLMERVNREVVATAQRFSTQAASFAKAVSSFGGWEPIIAGWRDDFLAEEAFIADGGDPGFIITIEEALGVTWG